jgi:hypothetical protein
MPKKAAIIGVHLGIETKGGSNMLDAVEVGRCRERRPGFLLSNGGSPS